MKILGAGLLALILAALAYAISWLITCGILKLITMCFGLAFSWGIATGIWLVIILLKSIFRVTVNKE